MEHLGAAVEVRQVEREHVDAGKQATQRLDARLVRAVRLADEQRLVVEPHGVASLGELVVLEPPDHRQRQVAGERFRLAAAAGLSRLEQDRALRRHEHRVVDVDRVEVAGLSARLDHLGAGTREEAAELRVLFGQPRRVGLGAPVQLRSTRKRPRRTARGRRSSRGEHTAQQLEGSGLVEELVEVAALGALDA